MPIFAKGKEIKIGLIPVQPEDPEEDEEFPEQPFTNEQNYDNEDDEQLPMGSVHSLEKRRIAAKLFDDDRSESSGSLMIDSTISPSQGKNQKNDKEECEPKKLKLLKKMGSTNVNSPENSPESDDNTKKFGKMVRMDSYGGQASREAASRKNQENAKTLSPDLGHNRLDSPQRSPIKGVPKPFLTLPQPNKK